MDNQTKISLEKISQKSKIRELIDETNEIFESKIKQMNSIINSIKAEHNRLISKSKINNYKKIKI